MPASYTHYAVARETLRLLPEKIRNVAIEYPTLYYFGAQGADFCFFYSVLGGFSQNLGSYLHRRGGYPAFRVCQTFALQRPFYAYAAGYITHYAADVTFHPYVYEKSGKSLLRHTRLENAFDALFKSQALGADDFYPTKPNANERNELFLLYAAICAQIGFPPLKKREFFRAISLFNASLPPSSKLLSVYNRPFSKTVQTDALTMFSRSVETSVSWISLFSEYLKKKTPLPREVFGKSYLTANPF